jgi:hypothetical protein
MTLPSSVRTMNSVTGIDAAVLLPLSLTLLTFTVFAVLASARRTARHAGGLACAGTSRIDKIVPILATTGRPTTAGDADAAIFFDAQPAVPATIARHAHAINSRKFLPLRVGFPAPM